MFAVKTRDILFNARCVNLCEKFGLDTVSTACNMAFAIDLFEKSISTKTDTQEEDLEWKNKGIPAKKELERLDLHDVWQDLERRGYYKR